MIIGNIDFNLEALGEITEAQFRGLYTGKLSIDIDEVCKKLSKYFKDVPKAQTSSRKRKKSK